MDLIRFKSIRGNTEMCGHIGMHLIGKNGESY